MTDDVLTAARAEIDAIDRELLALVARRRAVVAALGVWKRDHGRPAADPDREQRLLDARARDAADLGLPSALAVELFELVLRWSRRHLEEVMRGE